MPLPPSWDTRRVFGTYKNFDDGTPAKGSVTFDPQRVVTAPEGAGRTIVMPRPRTVQLDAEGKIDLLLPATDDTDLDAGDWVYKVTERIEPANRVYYIEVPLSGGDIDLASVAPMVPPPQLESTRGPAGASVVDAIDNGDGTMSFELSNGLTVGPVTIPNGVPGVSVISAIDNGNGTVSFGLSDGSTIGPVALPAGAAGPAGLVWKGAWSAATTYAINDAVPYGGSSYRRKVAGKTSGTPDADTTNWELIASKGDTGPGVSLSTADPAALGTAAPGTGTAASRDDHAHPMPSAADVGALALTGGTVNGETTINVGGVDVLKVCQQDGNYGSTAVTIDGGNRTNQPALGLYNLGDGDGGLVLAWAGSGGVAHESQSGDYLVRTTNRCMQFVCQGDAYSYWFDSAFGFSSYVSTATKTTMRVQAHEGITAPIQSWHTFDQTLKASVLPNGGSRWAASVSPLVDTDASLGEASLRWAQVYAQDGTIQTSDARQKSAVQALTPTLIAIGLQCAREMGTFQWLSRVAEVGEENARKHFGITSQRVTAIFTEHGEDAFSYGIVCHDEWPEREETVASAEFEERETGELDENGSPKLETVETRPAIMRTIPAGDTYSLRYDELTRLIAAALLADQDDLRARVEALEMGGAP